MRAARPISAAHFGAGLSEREVDFLIRTEWARSAEDMLWRRSKLGLHMTQSERTALHLFLETAAMAS